MRLRNGKNTKEPNQVLSKRTNSLKDTKAIMNETIVIIENNFSKKKYGPTIKRIDAANQVYKNMIDLLENALFTKEQQNHLAETLLQRIKFLLFQVDEQLHNRMIIKNERRCVALRKLLTRFMESITIIQKFLDVPIVIKYNILTEFNKKVTDAFNKLT
jgi:hypothetical protein